MNEKLISEIKQNGKTAKGKKLFENYRALRGMAFSATNNLR